MTDYDVVFRDDFTGTDAAPPHRGKWFGYIGRFNSTITLDELKFEILSNELHLKVLSSGGVDHTATVSALSRAEFKPPFKFRFRTKMHTWDSRQALCSNDIRDGYLPGTGEVTSSYIYGLRYAWWDIQQGGKFYLTVWKDAGWSGTDSGAVVPEVDVWYIIDGEVTDSGKYWHLDISFTKESTMDVKWSQSVDFDRCMTEHLRLELYTMCVDETVECFYDDVLVWGIATKKAGVRVSVSDLAGDDHIITNDVLSYRVSYREKSYPSAEVVIRNPGNKYSTISLKHEIEICAGTEYVKWLLFRGYLEKPKRTYPPALLYLESSKGYAKRLDFRETDSNSWPATTTGAIVQDIITTYFSGVFTYDHVAAGTVIDMESDDEPWRRSKRVG